MKNLIGVILGFLYVMGIIFLGKVFAKKSNEASRKFIHIMLAPYWIIAIIFFDNVIFATALPFLFVILNFLSYKFNLIKQMERTEEEKDGLGTVYYAFSLTILSIITFGPLNNYKNVCGPLVALVGVLVMALGDGFAAIVGKNVKSLEYKVGKTRKTLAGSGAMFFISLIIISIFLAYIEVPAWIVKSIIIALISTILEAISIKGLDNITVPLITTFIIFLVI